MSLADRLEQARRSTPVIAGATPSTSDTGSGQPATTADPFAAVKESVHQALIASLGPQLYDPHLSQVDLEQRVRVTLQEVLEAENTPLSNSDRTRIAQEVADEILGHGPLEPLLRDSEITEIMVNGPHQIYIERAGKIHAVAASFHSDAHLRRVIDKIVARVGRRIDEAQPMVDARLPDGSRVNAVIGLFRIEGVVGA